MKAVAIMITLTGHGGYLIIFEVYGGLKIRLLVYGPDGV